ncbi:hypothetical protein EC957_003642 [Mortierella hygrophila]|uniref:F-box domain-containing protein n=1 Tax=Mortierella hygrophila TaxID=979708 RepID=A0A9P6F378_9FUNG|nr:hypothetical protein EC957_003642 [Mortierella hygrophila]
MPQGIGPSLASVPELLELIGRHLDLPDLARCSLTCRLWHHTLSPLLWETFDDSLYNWPRIMLALYSETDTGRRQKAWVDALFSKYGHHIRTLRVRRYYTVLVASECGGCTRLVSLQSFDFAEGLTAVSKKSGSGWCLESTKAVIPTIVENAIGVQSSRDWRSKAAKDRDMTTARRFWMLLYLNSSTLRSVRLDKSLGNLCTLPSFDLLDKILSGLQNLETLSNTMYPMDADVVLQQIPSLRSITGCPKRDTSSVAFNNVRFFDVSTGMDPSTFRHYLTKFPNLNCLCLERIVESLSTHPQQQQPIAVQDNNVSFQLSEIRFTLDDSTDNPTRLVFSYLPHLRHITLKRLRGYIAHIIVTYCRELETFRQLENEDVFLTGPTTDTALILLQGCPKLKVLDVYQSQVRAESLLASPPWVCEKLETLRCMITGVSRLSTQDMKTLNDLSVSGSSRNVFLTKQDRNALKTGRETMGQQQRILERLANLTHLKVLELASKRPKDNRLRPDEDHLYVDHFSDTLELTLASGLGQLAALKGLEMFGFEGCNHEIDRPELDWIVKSWPRLRAMRGLRQTGVLTSRFEMRKTELRAYMQQLRPDIQQQGGK